jgi:membrane protease YdiL (CAAX protease family)
MQLAILEPVSVFAMIMAYIWVLRFSVPWLWLPIVLMLLISHRVHGERAGELGFNRRNLGPLFRRFAVPLLLLTLVLVASGVVFQTIRQIGFDSAILAWLAYLPWGLFQQYVLNGYFLNRLGDSLSYQAAPLAAAALFAGAHLPNGFLMAVTFLMGYSSAYIYRKYNNLYFLGLAHATIGFVLFLVVPDSISHHLRVGPGWFRP